MIAQLVERETVVGSGMLSSLGRRFDSVSRDVARFSRKCLARDIRSWANDPPWMRIIREPSKHALLKRNTRLLHHSLTPGVTKLFARRVGLMTEWRSEI